MSLPAARRIINGRTYASPWDPACYGAVELPPKRRPWGDILFGLAMAAVVCATVYVLLVYRSAP